MQKLPEISARIEEELRGLAREFELPPLSAVPASYREAIVAFLLRKGKRLRPALFILSYAGYAAEPAPNLYRAAIALELLHDFILIHDDIVDGSQVRRNGPSLHALLQRKLAGSRAARFSGENMAMVVGDMLYALGIRLFLAVECPAERKAAALEYLTQAAIYTACGELRELLDSLAPLEGVTPEAIAETCQWKTAYYSFACPMVTGAILGGASPADVELLLKFALSMGLAYQIRDDILDLTDGHSAAGGEPELCDLRDGKLTLPLWYALRHGSREDQARLTALLDGGGRTHRDLLAARDIIVRAGGVAYARREIERCVERGRGLLGGLAVSEACREALWRHTLQILGT
jgi:geranylgeranyl diphosphate synthase, type I